jgi:subtilisin family serine protease
MFGLVFPQVEPRILWLTWEGVMKYEKIAASLASAMSDFEDRGREGLSKHIRTLGIIAPVEGPKPPRVSVFLHCDREANLDHLTEYNITINQARGSVRTAFLPLESVPALTEEPTVHRVVASRYLKLLMDVAPGTVRLPTFRKNSGLSGNGVIVGVVDTGIDSSHAAFAGRIQRIWDQTLPGPGVAEGAYGEELAGAAMAKSRDLRGHGTHVCGIAAGSDPVYEGVASGAELVMVKSDLNDTHISDGVRYIFRLAREQKKPAVVNLSLGGQYDAHDGTDSLSLSIDAETGKGKIVCCAAGNEGRDAIHAQLSMSAGATATTDFSLLPASNPLVGPRSELDGWYSGSDQFEVAIKSPSGFQTPFQGSIIASNPANTYSPSEGRVRIITPGPDPNNGDFNFQIEILPNSNPLPNDPKWQLLLRALKVKKAGLVDIWAPDGAAFDSAVASNNMKVGSPGAASSAVTVAAYTTKNTWTDLQGNSQSVGLAINTVSDFSSPGPLRNGNQKPEVTAPGAMIAAPLSSASLVDPGWVVASGFRLMAGTSMATPFVTGIVALLLEQDPGLDPAIAKQRLRQASSVPGHAVGAFDIKWGYGLVDCAIL